MPEWVEGDVVAGDIKVHFYRTPQGSARKLATTQQPSLILAHGLTDNGLCWARTARALAPAFDVVMVDARNHGLTERGVAGLEALAKDMAAVITELALQRPVAMGHSVGAAVVAGLAAFFPQLVSKIILEDPPWYSQPPAQSAAQIQKRKDGFVSYVQSLQALSLAQIVEAGQTQHPMWSAEEFAAWALAKRQLSEQAMNTLELGDWRDLVPQVRCPALLIYGDENEDGIVNQDLTRRIEALNPHFSSSQVAGAGHNVRREGFADFLSSVERFLAS